MSAKKTAAAPKETAETKKTAPPEPLNVVYCGPTIKGVCRQYTAFSNGVPDGVKAIIEKAPEVSALIVPVEELGKIKKELNTPNSAAALIYLSTIKSLRR